MDKFRSFGSDSIDIKYCGTLKEIINCWPIYYYRYAPNGDILMIDKGLNCLHVNDRLYTGTYTQNRDIELDTKLDAFFESMEIGSYLYSINGKTAFYSKNDNIVPFKDNFWSVWSRIPSFIENSKATKYAILALGHNRELLRVTYDNGLASLFWILLEMVKSNLVNEGITPNLDLFAALADHMCRMKEIQTIDNATFPKTELELQEILEAVLKKYKDIHGRIPVENSITNENLISKFRKFGTRKGKKYLDRGNKLVSIDIPTVNLSLFQVVTGGVLEKTLVSKNLDVDRNMFPDIVKATLHIGILYLYTIPNYDKERLKHSVLDYFLDDEVQIVNDIIGNPTSLLLGRTNNEYVS